MPEFESAYRAALQTRSAERRAQTRPYPAASDAAVVSYYASKASFQALAPAAQMLRRLYLEKFRERIRQGCPTASMRLPFIAQMIDRIEQPILCARFDQGDARA